MMKWAVDVGHARGTGAKGYDVAEHEACTKIGRELVDLLRAAGDEADLIDFAHMSNACDLKATRKAIEAGGYGAAISLHCDCSGNATAHGGHVCYRSAGGRELALSIARPLAAFLPGRADIIKKRLDLYILRAKGPKSVLVECGFVSNAGDVEKIWGQPGKIAACIAEGALKWAKERG